MEYNEIRDEETSQRNGVVKMIKAMIKVIKNDGDVLVTTDVISFNNIDDLIRYCTSRTNYKYTYDYILVKEGE